MTTYRTGNAIGSADPRDLYDNAENLDELVNSQDKTEHPDRLGVSRKTWHGMEQGFQAFLQSSGYQDLGDYAAGIEITARNQVIRADGELWRLSASEDLPYTTTGAGMPEGGAFVAVGDAALRQDLANPDKGGGLVRIATSTGEQTLAEALNDRATQSQVSQRVRFVDTIESLRELTAADGDEASITKTGRSGRFVFDASDMSSQVDHDTESGIYIAPDSDPTGVSGAWVRQYDVSAPVSVKWFGAAADGATSDSVAIEAALEFSGCAALSKGKVHRLDSSITPSIDFILYGYGSSVIWDDETINAINIVGVAGEVLGGEYTQEAIGTSQSPGSEVGQAVRINGDDTRVADLVVNNTAIVGYQSNRVTVEGCRCYGQENVGNGIFLRECHDFKILNNLTDGYTSDGIKISMRDDSSATSRYGVIRGNTSQNNLDHALDTFVGGRSLIIDGNVFKGRVTLKNSGAELSNANGWPRDQVFSNNIVESGSLEVASNNCSVTGNLFRGGTKGVLIGTSTVATVQNVTVSGNTFVGCSDRAVEAGVSTSSPSACEGFSITGNTFESCTGDGTITIRGNHFTVQGNIIRNSGAGNRGINFVSGSRGSICGNTIVSPSGTLDRGIFVGGNNSAVVGNTVDNASFPISNTGTGNTVANNAA